MTGWRWLFLLLAVVSCVVGREAIAQEAGEAPPAEWAELLSALASKDADARQKTYDALAEKGDARLLPAIEAYRAGLLEDRGDGQLVIYQSRVEIEGRGKVYPLVDALTGQPLLDAAGQPVYADKLPKDLLKAPRPDRGAVTELIGTLTLLDPDPAQRKVAIQKAGDRADADALESLKELLAKNPQSGNATVLRESIARIEIVHGDRDAKIAAAKTLGDIGSNAAASSLGKALEAANRDGDVDLQLVIRDGIARIERYQTTMRWIKYGFDGISLGSILILLGLGLSIIFGLMGVINMAHGEFMMAGAFTTLVVGQLFQKYLPAYFDWYLLVAIPAAFLVAGLIGYVCEVTVIRKLYGRPLDSLLATVGIAYVLIQAARVWFGDNVAVTPPSWLVGGWEVAHDFVLPLNRLFIIGFCAACIALTYGLIRGTRLGLLLRATTQDRETASSLGVSTRLIDGFTFAFGAGLAGMAGVAVAMFDNTNPQMGVRYIVDSFMVVVIGGVGNLAGVIVAGLGLGIVGKFLEPMLANPPFSLVLGTTGAAIYAKIAVLIGIIVILQWRPAGLFPAKGRLADA